MKRLNRWISAVLLMASASTFAAEAPSALATRLLDQLDAAQYSAAEAMFSAEMKAAVPADKLKAVWESLPAQMGAAGKRGDAQISEADGYRIVVIPLDYANGHLQARIVLDKDDKVAGFLVQPAAPPAAAAPAADASFIEQPFSVPIGADGKNSLPATLALPKGKGPFPAVVLVHGSGPQDRDETTGPNRPFLDIARGLAAQGIAVLRYEKRTHARPQDFTGAFSIDDETTDDAVSAVTALANTTGIDPKHLYVLGHSQGGMLAGRIAKASGDKLAGLILLAAPVRPILDILAEQNRYLVNLDGNISAEEQTHLDALDAAIATVRRDPTATLMNLPGSFWQQLEQVDPVADVRNSGLPVLLLQGGRDFQVVDAEWQLWKKGLQGERYRFHHYPALNHLGITSNGKGGMAEYEQAGHVDAALINDIASWIKAQ
ncbi:MAG: alpha/beta hydrolase [Stenotrophomonas sp.]|uniref:alpha/beta hydrolase n=1 Tax=Stenotrophomonas sp. TaxID=69392 RepID=UPI003D6C807E